MCAAAPRPCSILPVPAGQRDHWRGVRHGHALLNLRCPGACGESQQLGMPAGTPRARGSTLLPHLVDPGTACLHRAPRLLQPPRPDPGHLAASLIPAHPTTQILTFVLLFLLSFSGFLVSDVPVYFRWITKISYLTYAYAAGAWRCNAAQWGCASAADAAATHTCVSSTIQPCSPAPSLLFRLPPLFSRQKRV